MSESPITSTAGQRHPMRLATEQFDAANGWTGGSIYIQNLLRALRSLPVEQRPFTLLMRRLGEKPYAAEVDKFVEVSLPPLSKIQRIRDKVLREMKRPVPVRHAISQSLVENRVDVLFTHSIYKNALTVPLMGWVPDFQYLHLPEIAGPVQVQQFTEYHQALIAQSKVLLVSSQDVLKDLTKFDPSAVARTHVVPFVAQIPAEVYATDPGYISGKYGIPQRYFYLPNQFWKHKNHQVVIQALKILKSRAVDVTVVCTGNTTDDRNPGYFASLLTEVALAGVHNHFRILGLVPRDDVFPLQRQSLAILQPSLFEGWSTSIEEAKSLGKRVVASDLSVNLEQIPDADFFPRHDAVKLADILQSVARQASPGPDLAREAAARAACPGRVLAFAQKFAAVVQQASA